MHKQKLSALSLAVSVSLAGISGLPTYADDEQIEFTIIKGTISRDPDSNLPPSPPSTPMVDVNLYVTGTLAGTHDEVTLDQESTITSNNNNDPALTIDTKDVGSDTGNLWMDLIAEGSINGLNNGYGGSASATGLRVLDSAGSNTMDGSITIAPTGVIRGVTALDLQTVIQGGVINLGQIIGNISATGTNLTNSGTISSDTITVQNLTNSAGGTITGASLNYNGTLTNNGTINVDGLTPNGNIDTSGGTLAVNSGLDMSSNDIILTDGELMISFDSLEKLITGIGTLTLSEDSKITISLDAELYDLNPAKHIF